MKSFLFISSFLVLLSCTSNATQSSKIEGTKTNIEEALLNREDISEEKRDDWEEIQNYIAALNMHNLLPIKDRLHKYVNEPPWILRVRK